MDSNHRRRCQQIYSLSPLATREPTHFALSCYSIILYSILSKEKADDRTRTDNLLITNQLLCQLSHIGNNWDLQGSNLWPSACKADALPAELRSRSSMLINISTYLKKYLLLFIRSTQIGLEPTTFAVTGRRSNQLSHWAFKGYTLKTDTENNL